jgi:hypothetical protein
MVATITLCNLCILLYVQNYPHWVVGLLLYAIFGAIAALPTGVAIIIAAYVIANPRKPTQ